MIFHFVSHLLPELFLAFWAVGLLILEMFGSSMRLCHRTPIAGLVVIGGVIVYSYSLPSISLFNGLLYTSSWSAFTKLVLLILAGLAWQLQSRATTSQPPVFFLLTLLLSAFILSSATNLWLILICYLWCFISLFFIDVHFIENAKKEVSGHWLQTDLISALLLTFGLVFFFFITKEANWLVTPVESIRHLTIPMLLIFAGLRYLILNNYPAWMAEAFNSSIAVNLIFMPFVEVILMTYLLLPALKCTDQAIIFSVIGLYGLGLGFYTIFKIKTISSRTQFLIESLPIQNSFILIAIAAGKSYGFSIGVYYSLFYLFSIWALLNTEELNEYNPLRFTAWFNLAGLPLTPGFALRFEMVLANRHQNFIWLFLIVLFNLLTFWIYARQFKKDSSSKNAHLQSSNVRIAPLWQWALVIFFLLNGIFWRIPVSWISRLFLTINPY